MRSDRLRKCSRLTAAKNKARSFTTEIPKEKTMLIRYSCKDMGLNCSFVVKAVTMEEVIKKALEHVRETHAADFNRIQSPAEIAQMEQALQRSTRVVAG